MRQIAFSGQLSEAEYRQINWLVAQKAMLAIVAIAFLLAATGLFVNSTEFWLTYVLPMAFVLALIPVYLRLMIRRHWKNNKMLQQPVSGFVSDEGITWNVADLCSARIPWNLLLKYRQAVSLVLAYQGINQVYYFPRRYFASDEDWTEFRNIVCSKLPRK